MNYEDDEWDYQPQPFAPVHPEPADSFGALPSSTSGTSGIDPSTIADPFGTLPSSTSGGHAEVLPPSSLGSMLSRRYGFIPPIVDLSLPHCGREQWNRVMIVLGMKGTDPTGHQLLNDAIIEFVSPLAGLVRKTPQTLASNGLPVVRGVHANFGWPDRRTTVQPLAKHLGSDSINIPPLRPPAELWDLHEYSSRSLRATGKLGAVVVRSYRSIGRDSRFRKSDDSNSKEHILTDWEPLRLFVLATSNNPDVPWSLAFTSAADTIHACRVSTTQPTEIVRHFLIHGIAFRTLLPLSRDWRPRAQITREDRQAVPFKLEIPFRSLNYKFSPADYAVHERHTELLLSQDLGHVAHQMGGIIWRLAEEYISDKIVLEGPSATSVRYGFGLFLRGPADEIFCDDELEADELDIICGLHLVLLGILHLPSYVHC